MMSECFEETKKKIIIILLAGILLLNLSSCADKEMEYSYTIKDALKISTYLFDENSEEDYFIQNKEGTFGYNKDENVYDFERLKINEIELMYPLEITKEMVNLNIYFEFDGIIEIISKDKDVQLSANFNIPIGEPFRGSEDVIGRVYGFEIKLLNEGFIAVNPLSSNRGQLWAENGIDFLPYCLGREYYLDVNAYKFDNTEQAVIKAQLKLVQLEDKTQSGHEDCKSGCFSIELTSYEYSDVYKLLDEIVDDDDDE